MDQNAINTEELRKSSTEWNLASDVDLFKKLQSFSENVLDNAKSTLSHMDELEDNLNKTFLNVKTTINNFHGIADNQFIENRVQEEEDTMTLHQDLENCTPKKMEQENLESKINACADSLNKRFEAIEIDLEDKDERHIILKPKNRYKERKLPHIVGSHEFSTDGTLGISKLNFDAASSSESDNDYESPELIITPNRKFAGARSYKNDLIKSDSTTTIETESSQNTSMIISNIDIGVDTEKAEVSSVDGNVIKKDKPLLPKFDLPKTPPESEKPMEEESIQARLSKILMQNNDKFSKIAPPKGPKGYQIDKDESSDEDIFKQSSNPVSAGDASVKKKEGTIVKERKQQIKSLSASVSDMHPAQEIQPDDLLPNVPTKILHSLSKDRPKILAKRRLPTRTPTPEQIPSKPTSVNLSQKVKDNDVSKEIKEDWALSPMTDEEDLFVLPALDLSKDISSNNLFSGSNLLSPGSSIDTQIATITISEPTEHITSLKDLMEIDDDGVHNDQLFSEQPENPFKNKIDFSWKFDSSEDLFTCSTNLLGSLNENNDLFSSNKLEEDLFSNKNDSLFKSQDLTINKNESINIAKTSQASTKKTNLFDEALLCDEEDDIKLFSGNKRTYQFSSSDDLFTSSSQAVTTVKDTSKQENLPKKEKKLFDDPLFQENMDL